MANKSRRHPLRTAELGLRNQNANHSAAAFSCPLGRTDLSHGSHINSQFVGVARGGGGRQVLYELPNIDIEQINDVTHIHNASCSEMRKVDQMTKVRRRMTKQGQISVFWSLPPPPPLHPRRKCSHSPLVRKVLQYKYNCIILS